MCHIQNSSMHSKEQFFQIRGNALYRVGGSGVRMSSFGFRVSGVEFRVSRFRFRVSGLRMRAEGFRSLSSCSEFSGFLLRICHMLVSYGVYKADPF